MRLKRHININLLRLVYNSWHGYEHNYSIEKKALGPGGNADVFKAIRIADGKEVAIKILKNIFRKSNEKRARFEDEIRVMFENSPIIDGILPIYDFSIKGCWYTMPIATPVKQEKIKTSRTCSKRLEPNSFSIIFCISWSVR